MRRYIVLLLITGIVWAQTDFDTLILKSGTTYLGEYSKIEGEIVYFKPQNAFAFQPISIKLIQTLQLKDGQFIIGSSSDILTYEGYQKLSTKEKAFYDAAGDAKKWLFYPPVAFSIFVSSLVIAGDEAWEFPVGLGTSAASLTIPYLLLKALTSKKTENFNSKDRQLYEKVYFEEYKKRKYKYIMISTGATALIAGAVTFYVLSNLSFGDDYDVCFDPRC